MMCPDIVDAVTPCPDYSMSDDVRLLARLVLGQESASAIADKSWPTLVVLAERHRLAPWLAWHIGKIDPTRLAQLELAPLQRALLRSARRCTLHAIALRDIQHWLNKAGIRVLWLKGTVLGPTVYPDPALRPMADLDMLVPYEQGETAARLLLNNGYRLAALDSFNGMQHLDSPKRKTNHHYELVGGPAAGVAVEIHFRLLAQNDRLLPVAAHDWFWQNPENVLLSDGLVLTAPAPEAHLLYLAAHAVLQHGESESLLNWLDLHLLIQHYQFDWCHLLNQAAALSWSTALYHALDRTTAAFNTAIPEFVLVALRSCRTKEIGSDPTLSFQGEGLRWMRTRSALVSMPLRQKVDYVVGSLMPAPAYMRRKYDPTGKTPLWHLYLGRWRNLAADILAARRKRKRARLASVPREQAAMSARLVQGLLDANLPATFRAGGNSMHPTIRDGESVRVRPIIDACDMSSGAILLYWHHGRLVLHRLIVRDGRICLTTGDAAGEGKDRIPVEAVIGVAEQVWRGSRSIRLDTSQARWVGRCWLWLRPWRRRVAIRKARSKGND